MSGEKRNPETIERRGPDRTADDASWETKVLARLGRRVAEALEPPPAGGESPDLGWEQKSLELLRNRIQRPQDE